MQWVITTKIFLPLGIENRAALHHVRCMKNFDVIIVGGGMVGLTAAIALAKQGLRVAVLDRAKLSTQQLPEFDGRVSAISYGSRCILDALEIWPNLQGKAQPIWDIRVHEMGGFGQVHYHHADVEDEPMGHIIENRHIRAGLVGVMKQYQQISLFEQCEWRSTKVGKGRVSLDLSDGEQLHASLLLAADGKFSPLRRNYNLETIERDYAQTAIVATIEHQQAHQGLALERFFAQGPFAVLPMQDKRSSLVWVEKEATVRALLALPEGEFTHYLEEKMQGYLGKLQLVSKRWSYPLTAVLAQDVVAERFALMGDAAHSIHPIAGQGVNLGFRDVAALDEVIAEAISSGEDVGSQAVLERYQQWRRFDASVMLSATDGLNQLFSNDNKLLSFVRNAGFSAVNDWPKLRNFLMRHAMGIEGQLPRLAKNVA